MHRVRTMASTSGQTPVSHDAPTQTAHTTQKSLVATTRSVFLGFVFFIPGASGWFLFFPGGLRRLQLSPGCTVFPGVGSVTLGTMDVGGASFHWCTCALCVLC